MNLIDWIIVIAVLIAVSSGYRRGFWLSLAQYVGLVFGVLVGAALARFIMDLFRVSGGPSRSLGAIIVLIVFGTVGSTIGFWLGEPIRIRLVARPGRGRADSVGGAIFSGLAVLTVSWFLGLAFDRIPNPGLAQAIQHSAILRRLDAIAPRPPAFLAQVQQILSGVQFPSAFSGLEPSLAPAQPIPGAADTPGVRTAAAATVKIEGQGCGGVVVGSGFPFASDLVVTNAHVVAGTSGTRVFTRQGQRLAATAVLFDSQRDLAVLYVPGLSNQALGFADGGRGTSGAAIGYPGGGAEEVSPAVIDGSVQAEGRDIYGQNLVVRQIWIVEAIVRPGNSGGPLVDRDGNVLGVIFAASTSQPGQAYALTDAEIQPDLKQAQGQTRASGVGPCAL